MMNIKLSQYAKNNSIVYRTAWKWFKEGKIENAFTSPSGSIFVKVDEENRSEVKRAIIYARVSNNNRKESLKDQQLFLEQYASTKGYKVIASFKEVGSGMNDTRKTLQKILDRSDYDVIVVENKDRLTRFGFNYIETLLNKNNISIDVVNFTDDDKQDLMQDLISIIYSFSARLYGKRKAKRKEHIEKFLNE